LRRRFRYQIVDLEFEAGRELRRRGTLTDQHYARFFVFAVFVIFFFKGTSRGGGFVFMDLRWLILVGGCRPVFFS